ncbi:TetR family transcriptional regulator [Methylobacterium variabile]|uniref:TetR family transcriptional regulator n=1 Tax=Methylobacterium variabile TaxID=298794 RepID=A0A0J6T890_9HYPH|nr:TetR/AcrR family transcriptional regulator [Methylobacterium variabile]KMO42057.1 TetR family transcriptional regulator [Methylobacterium variabile]
MGDEDDKLRADAQANRDRILDVAREAFKADPRASLNSIAKGAGIGPGTLYRHFPSREALLAGVYKKEIDALVSLVPTMLADRPPLDALRHWAERFIGFGELKHGVFDTLGGGLTAQDKQAAYKPLAGAVRQLLMACVEAGTIKPEVEPDDILTLLGLLLRIPASPAGKAQSKRIIDLIFQGIMINNGPIDC